MTLRHASATNVYLPYDSNVAIGFIKDVSKFRLNEYVTYMPSEKLEGTYLEIGRDEGARIKSLDDNVWKDGDVAPSGEDGLKVPFEYKFYRCERRAEASQLGNMTLDQASFDIRNIYVKEMSKLMMTKRTRRVLNELETESNWTSVGHIKTSAQLTGATGSAAYWKNASSDKNSPSYNIIWNSINHAIREIHRDTNETVDFEDIVMIVSPDRAIDMAQSDEISNYVREQPSAVQILKDGFEGVNERRWGLPTHYKGVRIMVETTSYLDGNKTSAGTHSTSRMYAKSNDSAILVARPGGLDGIPGSKSFSTIQVFHYKGLLEVKAINDTINERLTLRVVETTDEKVVAPVSGYMIKGIGE